MTELWIVLGVLFWIGCGVLHFGLYFAYFQREYAIIARKNDRKDFWFALCLSGFGPCALFADFMTFRPDPWRHGVKWK